MKHVFSSAREEREAGPAPQKQILRRSSLVGGSFAAFPSQQPSPYIHLLTLGFLCFFLLTLFSAIFIFLRDIPSLTALIKHLNQYVCPIWTLHCLSWLHVCDSHDASLLTARLTPSSIIASRALINTLPIYLILSQHGGRR